jgi:hypothetical protein
VGQVGEEFGVPEKAMPDSLITPLCTGAVIMPAKSPSGSLAGAGQGFQDERGVGLVQLPGDHLG